VLRLIVLPVIALVAGSWLGVLIRRLPDGRPVALARSACESCGGTLRARDLIPVVSYLRLRGRCRDCQAPIGRFHLDVELVAVAVAFWAALEAGDDMVRLGASCVLGWTLLAAGWIDAQRMVLPDVLTIPLLLLGLAGTWWLNPPAIADRAAAAILGYVLFRSIAFGYRSLRGRDGLGQGDAKLLAAGGAWVGLAALPSVVLTSALLGILSALVLRALGYRLTRATQIPLGPSLALAVWLVWLYGT